MGATPPDEIAKQHAEACDILELHRLACAPRVDRGEIPLRWKSIPSIPAKIKVPTISPTTSLMTCANPNSPNDHDVGSAGVKKIVVKKKKDELEEVIDDMCNTFTIHPDYCISSRGQVDVTSIVKLITEGVHDPVENAAYGEDNTTKKRNNKKENGITTSKPKPSSQRIIYTYLLIGEYSE